MKIGTKVLVKAIAKRVGGVRGANSVSWESKKLKEPKEAYYVGYTYKHEGYYVPESETGDFFGVNYVPARLEVTNDVLVLRIKYTERSSDRFAFAKDVKEID